MSFGTNSPFGLKPVQLMGNVWNNQWTPFYLASATAFSAPANTTGLFINDPVVQTPAGGIDIAPAGATSILGTFQGCSYIDAVTRLPVFRKYLASGQTCLGKIEVYVTTNPDILYEIQIANSANGSAGPTLLTTNVNNNATFNVAAATYTDGSAANPGQGNVTTGISGYYLDSAHIANTQLFPLTIVQLTPSIFNNIYSTTQGNVIFNTALVRLNTSYYTSIAGSSAGV